MKKNRIYHYYVEGEDEKSLLNALKMVEMQKRNNLMKLKNRDKTFPNVLDKKFSIKEQ
ncbi:MAG: hypothetical protein ACI4DV_02210 [Lachnospiraceae bacterium]